MQSSSMSTDEQLQLLDIAVQKLFPYKGHPMQLETIRQLLFDKVDVILTAKTSFGKSIILQAISALILNSITIMILPLTTIGIEQKFKIDNLKYCRPCLLMHEVVSDTILD